MSIFGPSQKELDFRKALQVFSKFTIADCQIITISEVRGLENRSQTSENGLGPTPEQPSTSTANQPSNSGIQQTTIVTTEQTPTVPTEQTPIRSAPESNKMRVPRNLSPAQEGPETRRTKRMKLHNPTTELYDCSPSSSVAPSSPASYRTALEIGPLTSQNTLTLRSRMTLCHPHDIRQNGTSGDTNTSSETVVPDSLKQLKIVNTISRGTQSPAWINDKGGKRRVSKQNDNVSSQLSTSNESDAEDTADLGINNELMMAQHIKLLWGDQSINSFTNRIRQND